MSKSLLVLPLLALLTVPALAVQEFYIGEPIVKEGMQIVARGRLGWARICLTLRLGSEAVSQDAYACWNRDRW